MNCLLLLVALVVTPCPALFVTSQATAIDAVRQATPPAELELGGGYESLTRGMAAWNDVFGRVQAGVSPSVQLNAEAGRTERFDLVDSHFRVGGAVRPGAAWTVDGDIALSPSARFLPSFSVQANLNRGMGSGIVLGIGGRHATYDVGDVEIATARADYYSGGLRFGYALSVGFVEGESAPTHIASASSYFGEANAVTLLVALGESVERIGSGNLLIADVRSIALWGTQWGENRVALTYGASFHRQGALYDRRRGQIGMKVRL